MSERPTPETDMSQHEGLLKGNAMPTQVVHVNFARKLERERDEARADLEFRRGLYKVQEQYLETARSESDEAQEHLREIKQYGTEEINAAVDLRQKLAQVFLDLDNMQDQRDFAMKVIKRLEQERDEAREALASREVVIAQQKVITDLILERDRSRAVLQEIEAARWHTACELRRIATRALGSKT